MFSLCWTDMRNEPGYEGTYTTGRLSRHTFATVWDALWVPTLP